MQLIGHPRFSAAYHQIDWGTRSDGNISVVWTKDQSIVEDLKPSEYSRFRDKLFDFPTGDTSFLSTPNVSHLQPIVAAQNTLYF
jgi:hypothetical protein